MTGCQKTKSLLNRILPYCIVFTLSSLAGLAVYYVNRIGPFGDQCVLNVDLWSQYFPMYAHNAGADSVADLFYSWSGALGYNNWAQSAYYCNSAFLLLMRWIPLEYAVSALNWFCLLKISLSAVTCLALLRYKVKGSSVLLMAGAVSYSLCSYMLAFLSQFMWTDILIYAPLVILGLERLLWEKKPLLYFFMLALSMATSFYIGFALCIFCALYFIFATAPQLRFSIQQKKLRVTGGKALGMQFLRFSGFSLLAAGAAALILFPVGLAIGNTLASDVPPPSDVHLYFSATELLQELIPGRPLSLTYRGANLGIGILVFLLLPLYFLNKNIPRSKRASSALFLGLLFLSINCNVLDYFWHGFHFTNQLPNRWVFLLSLMMVMLCCQGAADLSGLSLPRTAIGCAIGISIAELVAGGIGAANAFPMRNHDRLFLYAAGVLLVLLSLLPRLSSRERRRLFSFCAACALAGMQLFSCAKAWLSVSQRSQSGLYTSTEPSYVRSMVETDSLGRQWKSGNSDFYRVHQNPFFTFNPSMFGNYRGMDYYSSTMNGSVFSLLKYLGNGVYADKVSSVYNIGSPVQNGLFGIRYILDTEGNLPALLPDTALVEPGVRENLQPLSLAFGVSEDILDWEYDPDVRALRNQNQLLDLLCGQAMGVFEKMEATCTNAHVTLGENEDWNRNHYTVNSGETDARFSYTLTCPQDGDYYIEHNFRDGNMTITTSAGTFPGIIQMNRFQYLGSFSAGETVTVEIIIPSTSPSWCGLDFYFFNQENWSRAYNQLSGQQLDVTAFESTKITGTIIMERAGLVLATIPQDGGWRVYCDGEKLDTLRIADALLGVYVPEGTHTLEFRYRVPGLVPGIGVSIFSILTAILVGCPGLRKKILPKKHPAPSNRT